MPDIEEEYIPGIGKKFSFKTLAGGSLTVIIHKEGRRDVYFTLDEDDDPFVFSLTDEEARKMSNILGDSYFEPIHIMSAKKALSEDIQGVRITSNSRIIGKMIKDLDIRKKTGASIVSIIRRDEIIKNPSATMVLKEDDLLMVVGTNDNVDLLEKMVSSS